MIGNAIRMSTAVSSRFGAGAVTATCRADLNAAIDEMEAAYGWDEADEPQAQCVSSPTRLTAFSPATLGGPPGTRAEVGRRSAMAWVASMVPFSLSSVGMQSSDAQAAPPDTTLSGTFCPTSALPMDAPILSLYTSTTSTARTCLGHSLATNFLKMGGTPVVHSLHSLKPGQGLMPLSKRATSEPHQWRSFMAQTRS